ncbi:MAG TPA: HEPN domain-containing protein [Bacteroidales bacterium]|nr:HEPN domain-containing protein [Bacteroidales bacterium]
MLFFLQKMGRWNSVVDRLYYACFYAVIALLLKNDIETQSHDGSRNQFGLNFVKTGLIDKRYGRLYSKLFDLRQKGDYGDVFEFDKNTVEPLIEETSTFIEVIKKLF